MAGIYPSWRDFVVSGDECFATDEFVRRCPVWPLKHGSNLAMVSDQEHVRQSDDGKSFDLVHRVCISQTGAGSFRMIFTPIRIVPKEWLDLMKAGEACSPSSSE